MLIAAGNRKQNHCFLAADDCVPGLPFGGYKQSGIGREESLAELLEYTQEKNVFVNLKA